MTKQRTYTQVKRINDIGLYISSLGNDVYFEIVKFYENIYYGKENDFIKDGEFYKTGFSNVHESSFKNPESMFVVCFITNGILEFVGDRAFDLDHQEMRDFMFLVRSGIKKSLNYKT